jgi:hypothetical protein
LSFRTTFEAAHFAPHLPFYEARSRFRAKKAIAKCTWNGRCSLVAARERATRAERMGTHMLNWALTFFVIALIAAVLASAACGHVGNIGWLARGAVAWSSW